MTTLWQLCDSDVSFQVSWLSWTDVNPVNPLTPFPAPPPSVSLTIGQSHDYWPINNMLCWPGLLSGGYSDWTSLHVIYDSIQLLSDIILGCVLTCNFCFNTYKGSVSKSNISLVNWQCEHPPNGEDEQLPLPQKNPGVLHNLDQSIRQKSERNMYDLIQWQR